MRNDCDQESYFRISLKFHLIQGFPVPLSGCLFQMPDVLRLAKINHFLGNIFRVVGNAFKTFGGNNPVQAAGDGVGIFHHVLRELLMDMFVERVHFLVARNDGAGGDGVALHK